MPVTTLHFTNVGPFEEIEFDLDPQVNVFTGPNNAGKSTVLWVLGEILVFPFEFPKKLLLQDKTASFRINLTGERDLELAGELPISRTISRGVGGSEDEYWTQERWEECIELLQQVGYSKFIPALRRSTDYRSPGPTVAKGENVEEPNVLPSSTQEAVARLLSRSLRGTRRRNTSEENPDLGKRLALIASDPSLVSDEAVIQKIVELDYRSYLRGKKEFRAIIDKVGEMASEITDGFLHHFAGVDEDENGFFPKFETSDGTLPINTVSQGTQSVVQWLAHLLISYAEYYDFPSTLNDYPGILIVDEIDAHLHPSWQRRIIPTIVRHLPNLQLFCSTHSPLMLAGLKEGQVHLLSRDDERHIVVSKNEVDIVGWSADEILRTFMGVLNPTDLETKEHLDRLEILRGKETLTLEEEDELQRLRVSVNRQLLSGPVPSLVEQFADELRRSRAGSKAQ